MKFINLGEPIKIRIGTIRKCYWITLKKKETIDLSQRIGLSLGLKELKTTQGQIGNKIVETKQIDVDSIYTSDGLFLKELIKINGIGKKTAEDIVTWGTKEKLIESINQKIKLPFRDDIEEKLKENYGK